MTKFIFVTGGVVSSVGKGITVASFGRLLKSRGISVSIQKLDPYLNVDPGTMSPYQHGEVFVTQDGCETDLDLGHYERFIDVDLTRLSNLTAGQVYQSVITRERRGDYLGGTIQVVPHVTNEIKAHIYQIAQETKADVVVVEVGGTVGDIEGLPFLEAVRQTRAELGYGNSLCIHVTYLPYLTPTGELKTKPTQHSVKELRSIGIQPDVIVCRSDQPVPPELTKKISLMCGVDTRAVMPLQTVATIYEVPLLLEDSGLGDYVVEALGLSTKGKDMTEWRGMVDAIKAPKESLPIAIVGKYVELQDAYISVQEALKHAGGYHGREVQISWVHSESLEKDKDLNALKDVSGIVVPGGFGPRGIEGMIRAAKYARENKVPYLGLCLGMQIMVIEFARHVFKSSEPNSTEFDLETPYPVIDLMKAQRGVKDLGGTMRLGTYPCRLRPGTVAATAYGKPEVTERHRHRFEFNNQYRDQFEQEGLIASGIYPEMDLVEISELRDHPFMVGTQFHAEFLSRPYRPHPLFRDFIAVASKTIRPGGQHPLPLDTGAASSARPK